jgi:hypothetical protein
LNVNHTPPAAESGLAGPTKAGVAWFGVWLGKMGINTWSDVAALLAAVYSALLIAGWFHRRWARWRNERTLPEGDE